MAAICGMFRLPFIDTAVDRDVAVGNVAASGPSAAAKRQRSRPRRTVHDDQADDADPMSAGPG
jgi:hypothetical protein